MDQERLSNSYTQCCIINIQIISHLYVGKDYSCMTALNKEKLIIVLLKKFYGQGKQQTVNKSWHAQHARDN